MKLILKPKEYFEKLKQEINWDTKFTLKDDGQYYKNQLFMKFNKWYEADIVYKNVYSVKTEKNGYFNLHIDEFYTEKEYHDMKFNSKLDNILNEN